METFFHDLGYTLNGLWRVFWNPTLVVAAFVFATIMSSIYFLILRLHANRYDRHRCPTCGHAYETKKGAPIDWKEIKKQLEAGESCGATE